MPKAKIRMGGQWVDLGMTSSEVQDEINQATDQLRQQINNADEYITGAFKDGVINVIEAKKIASFLKALELAKADFDKRYEELYSHPKVSSETKNNLATQKNNTDNAYNTLVNLINTVQTDGKATEAERTSVESAFTDYKNQLALLSELIEIARREVTDNLDNRLTTAESSITQLNNEIQLRVTRTEYQQGIDQVRQDAEAYTDSAKAALQQQINDTNTYIDTAFKDGIIYDTEYRKIQSYLNTLQAKKNEFDQKYSEVYNNPNLTDPEKSNLATAKANYDTAYNNLINSINTAIADQKATPSETADVDAKFATYRSQLGVLAQAFEAAVYKISKKYTDGQIAPIDQRLTTAESTITQQADQIALKVSQSDYNGNTIASLINQTATTVQIQAEKINLNGKVTFSHFDSATQQAVTSRNFVKNSIFIDQRFWATWASQWTIDTTNQFESTNTVRYNQTGLATSDVNKKMTSNLFPVAEGKQYTLSAYVKSEDITSFDDATRIEFQWVNASGSAFAWNGTSMTPSQNNVWQRVTYTATAPVGAVKCQLNYYVKKNGKIWVAKPMVQEGSVATPHTDELLINPWTASGSTEIDGNHIKTGTISFDKAYGGTIKLGGAAYGNAALSMYTDDGDTMVQIDVNNRGFDYINVGRVNSDYVVTRDPDLLKTNLTLYVDPVGGSDTNDGLTTSTQLKTVQAAVNMLPQYLDDDVTIVVKAGSGMWQENIDVNGFVGTGNLTFDFTGFANIVEGTFEIRNCACRVTVKNLKISYPNNSSGTTTVVYAHNSFIELYNCQIYGRGQATHGIRLHYGARARINEVSCYDVTNAITLEYGCFANFWNMYGDATNYAAVYGSELLAHGTRSNGSKIEQQGGKIQWFNMTEPTGSLGNKNAPYTLGQGAIQTTQTFTPSGGDSWRTVYNSWRRDGSVRQGQWGGYGVHRGFWFFGTSISSVVTGKTIKSMRVYLKRLSTGGNSGNVTVVIRHHTLTSLPGNDSQPLVSNDQVQIPFKWGEAKWVTLPSSFYDDFQAGTAKGICIYTTDSSNNGYAVFDPNTCKLEITYEG